MADDFTGLYAGEFEEVAGTVRQEALDEANDMVRELDIVLGNARADESLSEEFANKARHTSLCLRKQASTVGLRLIGIIAHRMENYIGSAKELTGRTLDDIQIYIDKLVDVFEERIPMDADASKIVRELPSRYSFNETDVEVRNVEVMLVMLHGAASKYVERELQQCGFRVSTVTTVFEALPLIVDTKPDFVLISAVMPELYGIDLAIGLAAMPSTRNIPLALVTSLEPDDSQFMLLPKSIPVIHKGPSFGDDLFKALDDMFLI